MCVRILGKGTGKWSGSEGFLPNSGSLPLHTTCSHSSVSANNLSQLSHRPQELSSDSSWVQKCDGQNPSGCQNKRLEVKCFEQHWHSSMIYILVFQTPRILFFFPSWFAFHFSEAIFCHIKGRTPSVDKLRVTLNSIVACKKLWQKHSPASLVAQYYKDFRSEPATESFT